MFFFSGKRRLLKDRKKLWHWGENQAERFLKGKNYKLLARNFSSKTGEIDRIFTDPEGTIVFVEVRTKSSDKFALPEETVTTDKKIKLARTAKNFIACYNLNDRPCRFDFVAVILPATGKQRISHYESIFTP